MEWAKNHRTWTVDDWKNVIWSDESKFNVLNSDGKEYHWTNTPEKITDDSVKETLKFGAGNVMVWGCMTWWGVGHACKIDGNMDGDLYCDILRGELIDTINYYNLDISKITFQHDNDPKHKSKVATTTLQNLKLKVMEWPAQSPDLNPIEHLWDHLTRELKKKNLVISSKNHLWEVLEDVLKEKNTEFCRKLISTMSERVNDVINAKGGYTRW